MSKASTVQDQNRNMLVAAVADRKLTDAQVRLMLMRALDNMTTFEMEQMCEASLQMSVFDVDMHCMCK